MPKITFVKGVPLYAVSSDDSSSSSSSCSCSEDSSSSDSSSFDDFGDCYPAIPTEYTETGVAPLLLRITQSGVLLFVEGQQSLSLMHKQFRLFLNLQSDFLKAEEEHNQNFNPSEEGVTFSTLSLLGITIFLNGSCAELY